MTRDSTWTFLDDAGIPDTSVDPDLFAQSAVDLAMAIAGVSHDGAAVIGLIAASRGATPPAVWPHLIAATLSTFAADVFDPVLDAVPNLRAVVVASSEHHAAKGKR